MNSKNKEAKKDELKQKSLEGMNKTKTRTESDRLMRRAAREANEDVQMEDDDDVEYYRQEVGEEPAKGIIFFLIQNIVEIFYVVFHFYGFQNYSLQIQIEKDRYHRQPQANSQRKIVK